MKKYFSFIYMAIFLSVSGVYALAQETGDENTTRHAVVNLSVAFLREAPDYTAELGNQALMGTVVKVSDKHRYWKKVHTDEPYTAWCTELGLVEMTESELAAYLAAPKYICTAWRSCIYSQPSDKSPKICDIVEGDIMRQCPDSSERAVIKKGYAKVMLPDGQSGYVYKRDIRDYAAWKKQMSDLAEDPVELRQAAIIDEAMKFIGVPYLWGGNSPNGVDCSGLVKHIFYMNDIKLPRNASQQAKSGVPVNVRNGENLDLSGLQPADLLFFGTPASGDKKERITHVGIYLGDGQMIHSAQIVRINSLEAGRDNYYSGSKNLLRACRLIVK